GFRIASRSHTCSCRASSACFHYPYFFYLCGNNRDLHSFPTRRSSDLNPFEIGVAIAIKDALRSGDLYLPESKKHVSFWNLIYGRSEEHTSELQSPYDLVCRLLLEKKKKNENRHLLVLL